MGNRLRTTYYTRKVALVETDSKANECSHLQFAAAEVGDVRSSNVEPATNTIPGTDNLQVYSVTVDDGVIYPNPYITITPQGYTKHYYVGQERFATALGLGGWNIEPVAQNAREVDISHDWFGHFEEYYPFGEITSSTTNNLGRTGDAPVELQYECNSPMQLHSLHVLWDYDMFNTCIYSYLGSPYAPDEIFYIHPDHLGSASWITNKYAEPEQYIHYAPYGELLANQQVNTYDERYKFTGKERDAESGYDYFGARFLAQQLGIWLSVDPWSDIYPFISPYAYCFGNPIILFDPNGCGDPLTVMKVRKMLIKNTFGMVRTKYDENGKIVPKPHQGIDYYAPEGTDVMAVKDGVIVGCDVEGKGDYGKTITLQFENEDGEIAWAFYAHLSEIGVSIGDKVKEGEILGKTGTTGNAKRMKGEDQHLHFEYRIGSAKLGTGLTGRGDPNIIVDTKFEPDPNNEDNVRIKEGL